MYTIISYIKPKINNIYTITCTIVFNYITINFKCNNILLH